MKFRKLAHMVDVEKEIEKLQRLIEWLQDDFIKEKRKLEYLFILKDYMLNDGFTDFIRKDILLDDVLLQEFVMPLAETKFKRRKCTINYGVNRNDISRILYDFISFCTVKKGRKFGVGSALIERFLYEVVDDDPNNKEFVKFSNE